MSSWLLHAVAIGGAILLVEDPTVKSWLLGGIFLALTIRAAANGVLQIMLSNYLPYLLLLLVCVSVTLDDGIEHVLMVSWVLMLIWLLIPES